MEDLSHLLSDRPLTGGASMNPTNTVSVPPDMGVPGSESEASARVEAGQPGGAIPAAPVPPSTVVSGDAEPSPSPWTDAHAINSHGAWRQAVDAPPDAGQARDGLGRWRPV